MPESPQFESTVSFIRKQGYAIIPDVFHPAELAAVAEELSASELKRSRAGARHVLSLQAVSLVAHRNELLDIARGVLGPNAIPFRATFFDKSPTSNWLVAWHQDTALPLTSQNEVEGWGPWSIKDGVSYAHAPAEALEQVLALRVHLDDSSGVNGPLRVIPGTHCRGVLSDEETLRASTEQPMVECTVGAGGVIAMRPLVIHASSKSESELPRRVVHVEYASQLKITSGLQLAIA